MSEWCEFMAWWPIADPNLTPAEAKTEALEDLARVASQHGAYWDPAIPVRFEFPEYGVQTPLGVYAGDHIVAKTLVATRTVTT